MNANLLDTVRELYQNGFKEFFGSSSEVIRMYPRHSPAKHLSGFEEARICNWLIEASHQELFIVTYARPIIESLNFGGALK